MDNFRIKQLLAIVLSIAVVTFILIFMLKRCTPNRNIMATAYPANITVGEIVSFSDSTRNAKMWLWEFGDGKRSDQQAVSYQFNDPGKYKIRLTVDGDNERFFEIKVRDKEDNSKNLIIKIIAPDVAMQGEKIVFNGVGSADQWRWEMGENGIIDAREKSPIYSYKKPGDYVVLLTTENTQYPIRHNIRIEPIYTEGDSTDVAVIIGNDIRDRLQNIVNGKPFNTNFNYVVTKYFGGDQNTLVAINGEKYNDFYSYCQGLKHIGLKKVNIETVLAEIEDNQTGYVKQITVIQRNKILQND